MKHEQPPTELTWYYLGPLLDAEAGVLKYDRALHQVHGVPNNAVACCWCGLLTEGPGELVLTDDGRARLDAWKASPEGQRWLGEWDFSEEARGGNSAAETKAASAVPPSGVQPSLFEAAVQ